MPLRFQSGRSAAHLFFCAAAVIFVLRERSLAVTHNEVFGVDYLFRSTAPATIISIRSPDKTASGENADSEYRGKGPEFSIGYERIPAEYLTPFSRASWSWNSVSNQWDISGAYNTVQLREDKSFPFLFAGFSRTKAVSPSFSAGFETGFYLPLSSPRDEWNLPFLSTSTSQSTAYNYETAPGTCSALYNSDKRKLFVVPVMAALAWDPPGLFNASLGAGFYIAHLQIESVSGERFYADYTDTRGRVYSAGSVYEYGYWRSENRIIPAVKCALAARVRISDNSVLKLSAAASGLKKTDFLFQEYVLAGKTFRDGVVIGGIAYSLSVGWKILF